MTLLEQLLLYVRPRIVFRSPDKHIIIQDKIENGRAVRLLLYDKIRESGMYLDDYGKQDPLFYYMQTLKLITEHYPDIKNTLMIGGGGFVYPQIYLYKHPERSITVIENNPGLVELAKKYFSLDTNDKHLTINITDGFKYISDHAGDGSFDMIVFDAYTGDKAANDILSAQSLVKMHKMLKKEGILALNMVNEQMDVIAMNTYMLESTLKLIFANTRIVRCKGGGNCILMASDRKI
ncbi:spermidine synthase [Butyrivibrio sp. NC2002]|uniref:spermidine synthase n=1 Tax=Butyrivibrio sp. NC2002 TaxID=1410610 RepID=UPI000559D368|nr:fused MFS/spermidine synthase [Butyrivibrio sp. NC2002]